MLHFDHTARPRCGRRSLRDDGTKARANSFVAAMPPHPGCAAPKHSLNPPLKKEGRRSAKRRTVRATSCDAARAFAPSFPKLEKTGAPGTPLEQGALAFRRPTAVLTRVSPPARPGPRFLESPDANGRTLSGTSAASTSQSDHAPDGTMPRPPAHAVYGCVHGTAPAPPLGVPSRNASLASGIWLM